jgi:hypothetical protein
MCRKLYMAALYIIMMMCTTIGLSVCRKSSLDTRSED